MKFLPSILMLVPFLALSQVGGSNGYQVLELSTNARSVALAGSTVSLADGDISQFFENPATLDSARAGDIFFNLNPYFTDAIVFTGAYLFNVKKSGSFGVGLHYLDFGSFDRTDPAGNRLGEFGAKDYAVSIGKAHKLGPITLGASIKVLHSSIDSYGSTAIAADIGGVFSVTKNWSVGMVFSNIGTHLTRFNDLETADIPFDVKIGTTFKPEHMPLRFTLTTGNLVDSNIVEETSSEGRSNQQVEKILRRVNIGTELVLSENFQLLFGYSHKRKQELKLEEIGGGAGFSYGLMLNIKKIELRYSRATFHAAGGSSFISLQTNLNNFKSIL
ncbi:MAG: type IX secretion system protein PorQ [Cyclobacteriaceae bacterium]